MDAALMGGADFSENWRDASICSNSFYPSSEMRSSEEPRNKRTTERDVSPKLGRGRNRLGIQSTTIHNIFTLITPVSHQRSQSQVNQSY